MKKIMTWAGIVIGSLVALAIIAWPGLIIYAPDIHSAFLHTLPGVSQTKLPPGVTTTVVIENVTVIPMDSEHILEGNTVVIENGRIAHMGANGEVEIPVDAHIVEGEGRFLIPGLSDMHTHIWGAENDLLLYLANGVTTIRTMGSEPSVILEWRDQIRNGNRVGPNIWAWWPSIEDTLSPFADSEGMEEWSSDGGVRIIHTPEEAEALVAEAAALGVDGIKSHGITSSENYLALLESANEHGLLFDSHIPLDTLDCWDCFREYESPAIAHLEELLKLKRTTDEDLRQIAKDAADDGLWVTTTLYLMHSIAEQGADLESALAATTESIYVHPNVFIEYGWALDTNFYSFTGSEPQFANYLANQNKLLPMLNEAGARLMSGTDTALSYLVPGFSLHQELEVMADVGLSPYDVVKTSTYNPALFRGGLDEVGTIEEGKRADLVLLDANPLDNIANARQIAGVMVQGRYFDQSDLDLMLDLVAQDHEAFKTNNSIAKVAYPIVVVLLLAGFLVPWARRRKASQIAS
jgi:cytosine/adenosine deaminase-related metal-dependent hydrolase